MTRLRTSNYGANEKLNAASADLSVTGVGTITNTGAAITAPSTGITAGCMATAAIRDTHTAAVESNGANQLLLKAGLADLGTDADAQRSRINKLIRLMQSNGIMAGGPRTSRPTPVGATQAAAVTEVAAATLTVPVTTFVARTYTAGNGSAAAGGWDGAAGRDTALTEIVDVDDDNDALEAEFVLARVELAAYKAELDHLLAKAIELNFFPGVVGPGDLVNT
jgi:hypothetical protein